MAINDESIGHVITGDALSDLSDALVNNADAVFGVAAEIALKAQSALARPDPALVNELAARVRAELHTEDEDLTDMAEAAQDLLEALTVPENAGIETLRRHASAGLDALMGLDLALGNSAASGNSFRDDGMIPEVPDHLITLHALALKAFKPLSDHLHPGQWEAFCRESNVTLKDLGQDREFNQSTRKIRDALNDAPRMYGAI